MQEIKFKFILLTVLVPGYRGNYVPPGFKANLQPLPAGDTALLTKANAIITVKGSRLQPGDVLDAS